VAGLASRGTPRGGCCGGNAGAMAGAGPPGMPPVTPAGTKPVAPAGTRAAAGCAPGGPCLGDGCWEDGDGDLAGSLTAAEIAALAAMDRASDPEDDAAERDAGRSGAAPAALGCWPTGPAGAERCSPPGAGPVEALAGLTPRRLGAGGGFDAGGVADRVPAGPVLAGLAAGKWAAGVASASDDELAGLMIAWRRVASWAAAGELAAVAELGRRRQAQVSAGADRHLAEHVGDEVAMALTLTSWAADRLVDRAQGLARLPKTMAALAAGDIDVPKALVVLGELSGLGAVHAGRVEAAVIGRAAEWTTGELRRAVRRQVIAADPAAARRRKQQAAKQARVERWAEDAGTAALAGRDLPPAGVLAVDAHLTAWAKRLKAAGRGGTLDQLRAQVYLALLNGQPPDTLLLTAPGLGRPTPGPDSASPPGATHGAREPSDAPFRGGPAGAPSSASPPGATHGAREPSDAPFQGGPAGAPGSASPPGAPHGSGNSAGTHDQGSRTGAAAEAGRGAAPSPDGSRPAPGRPGINTSHREETTPPAPAAGKPSGRASGRPPASRPSRAAGPAGPPLRGSVHLVLPLSTWLGWSASPGEVAGFGPLDAADSRALAAALARDPATTWCVTVTGHDGRAAAHGCATTAPGPPPGRPATPRAGPGPPPPPNVRTWLAGVSLAWLETTDCSHRRASPGYRPSPALTHLVQVRQVTCTAPGCRRPATACDFEHTIPYHKGGRSCECNAGPCCRRHHRAKQASGWHLAQPCPGTFIWTTPHGRSYQTGPEPYPA